MDPIVPPPSDISARRLGGHRSALRRAPRDVKTVAVTADPRAPLAREADQVVWLDFTTERSVVSSRFITSSLVLLRADRPRALARSVILA